MIIGPSVAAMIHASRRGRAVMLIQGFLAIVFTLGMVLNQWTYIGIRIPRAVSISFCSGCLCIDSIDMADWRDDRIARAPKTSRPGHMWWLLRWGTDQTTLRESVLHSPFGVSPCVFGNAPDSYKTWWVADWVFIVALAFGAAFSRFFFQRVPKAGYCRNCGYCLTGAAHLKCPECGHTAHTSAQARGSARAGPTCRSASLSASEEDFDR